MKQEYREKTKVMFFAWGDSIHARRRIGIFCDDPSFEVGVISTFCYEFKNAKNYYLSNVLPVEERPSGRLIAFTAWLLTIVLSRFGGISKDECVNFVRDIFLVRRYLKAFRPNVIFLQTLMYPSYLSYFFLHKTPMVVTFWNGDVTWWAKWTGMERAFKKKIVEYGARKAAAVTVNSRAAYSACLQYGAEEKKIKLLRYPGVDLTIFKRQPDKMQARIRLGLKAETKMILCPRGLGGYLNSDTIIESVAEVIERFPDVLFLFLLREGDRAVWSLHSKRAGELGITNNLAAIDKVPWDAMPLYYNAADMMVSISSNDSLPNCMLEAMACGIPVVMGDIPQIREWITDGRNGYSVSPRDPSALAERIGWVITDHHNLVEEFVTRNINLIQRELDSRNVSVAVKALIHQLAGH